MVVVVDEGEDGVVVVREVEEEKKKKKAPIRKEAEGEGVGGGQEGNYVQTLPGGRALVHWARRGEEGLAGCGRG